VENVYSILGTFYDDLAKVLKRFVENEEDKEDYKYDCFAPYITKEPYQNQMEKALSLALTNVEKALAVNPSDDKNKYNRELLVAIKSGKSNGWY
jgi:hypothetical protein